VLFTRKLVRDLVRYPALAQTELALHDIDPDRLETARLLVEHEVAAAGADARVLATTNRRDALEGAGYVLCLVQVGGHQATVRDFEIPLAYGIRQTIGDTLGLGGISRALRTAPVLIRLAREMRELCPDAWLLNYTNPMAALCWATYASAPTARVVGLCHSVPHTLELLAGLLGVSAAEVDAVVAGINHQAHVLRFAVEGRDLLPSLPEAIEGDAHRRTTVRAELYRRFGYFQTESSEHAAEYVPWFLPHDEEIERFRIPVGEYVRRSAENLQRYEAAREAVLSGQPLAQTGGWEYAPALINAFEGGDELRLHANVRNGSLLPDLPADCCVEVPCRASAGTLEPEPIGPLPPQLAALNRAYAGVGELTVRAVLEESREYALQAALLDPATAAQASIETIARCLDDLVEAHAELLAAALVAAPPLAR
jgi:alpha-galactosidase